MPGVAACKEVTTTNWLVFSYLIGLLCWTGVNTTLFRIASGKSGIEELEFATFARDTNIVLRLSVILQYSDNYFVTLQA